MLLCLGEPSVRFLCCCWCSFLMWVFICWCSSFCCCSSFISRLLYHVTGTPPWLLRPVKASTSSELYHDYFWLSFLFHLPRVLRFWVGFFYPQAFFYLTLIPNIFGITYFYQGFPGSRQLFLGICRASYWSLKHTPSPSVRLIHSNPQCFIHLKFVFIHFNIGKVLLVVETMIRSATRLFSSSHDNIKQQSN